MSETTIDNLPTEIVIKILRCLDQVDLLNATLTCKLWNNLIESSCLWTLKLSLHNAYGADERWIDFMLTTNRKFGTIKLNRTKDITRNRTLEIFQKHGFNIVQLHVLHSYIVSFIEFAKILKCMPNLQHISIIETSTVRTEGGDVSEETLPDLKKLKSLEIIGSEYKIINCLQKAKLRKMKVLNSHNSHSLDCKPLEDFLKTQDKLTTLALRSIHRATSMIFRTENLNQAMPFQLTRLSLLHIKLQNSTNDYINLLKFLKPQAKTLLELEMGSNFPGFIFEFIFANMTKLRTLWLMMTEVPQDNDFYGQLKENRSIENLIFVKSPRFSNGTSQLLCALSEKLPNICSLNVQRFCDNGTLLVMARSLTKLTSLTTFSFNGELFNGVRFPNLKTLEIHRLDGYVDWNEFTKANSRLTNLTIEVTNDPLFLDVDHIQHITTNITLESLRLGQNFMTYELFFEIIRNNCPNLKIFDVHKSCVLNGLEDYVDGHRVRLCENGVIQCWKYFTLWNEDGGRLPLEFQWYDGENAIDPFESHFLSVIDQMYYDDENEDSWYVL